MRRSALIPSLTGLLVASSALFVIGGCADNNQSLYIIANLVPDNSCVVSPNEQGPFLASGTLDLVVGVTYHLYPLVRNDMPSMAEMKSFSESDGRLEAHNVFLKEASLHYSYGNAIRLQETEKTVPISGTVFVNGLAAVPVEVIDLDMGNKLYGKPTLHTRSEVDPYPTSGLVVDVTIKGEMADGTEIQSNVFSYPIRVCRGCLLSFPPEADDQTNTELDCDNTSSQSIGDMPCHPGQDEVVDCRLCKRLTGQMIEGDCDPM